MSPAFDGHLIEDPGFSRSLTWPTDEAPKGAAAASLVGGMLTALAPLLRPLSIEVILRAYQREPYEEVQLSQPFWSAATPEAEAEFRSLVSERFVHRKVEALTPAVVEALINEAGAAQKLGPGAVWTWEEVRIRSVEAHLPEALDQRAVLCLSVGGGDVGIEVRHRGDGAWVSGLECPPDSQPFKLFLSAQVGVPTLDLVTCWSLWMPGGAGESNVDAVIKALVARGWFA